jgi:hypothetical protein
LKFLQRKNKHNSCTTGCNILCPNFLCTFFFSKGISYPGKMYAILFSYHQVECFIGLKQYNIYWDSNSCSCRFDGWTMRALHKVTEGKEWNECCCEKEKFVFVVYSATDTNNSVRISMAYIFPTHEIPLKRKKVRKKFGQRILHPIVQLLCLFFRCKNFKIHFPWCEYCCV